MRVLFIYHNPRKRSLVPPSIALFSRLLKDIGVQVKLFDTTFYKYEDIDIDDIREDNLIIDSVPEREESRIEPKNMDIYEGLETMIEEFRPDLLAVTLQESVFEISISLLKNIKIPVIAGGVFPTFAPEKVLARPEIDMVCIGEGERTLVDLVKKMREGKDYSRIPNLWVKGKPRNPLAPPVNLDDNPLFDMEIFEDARFYRGMGGRMWKMFPVETHRGCVNKCGFCGSPIQNKMYIKETNKLFFRYKSIRKVREEISYYQKLGAEYLFFWADNFFTYPPKMMDEFCEMYSDFKIPFYCQCHPNLLSEEKVRKLKAVGMKRMGLGVEHGNEKFRRDVIHKYFLNDELIENLHMLTDVGVEYSINNMVGFPDETPELFMDTVELNRRHEANNTSCSIFAPFHGTALRELAIKRGYLHKDTLAPPTECESVLDMPQFTKEQILGKRRTFNMYVKFPKSRWKEIEKAETDDGIWNNLKKELLHSGGDWN